MAVYTSFSQQDIDIMQAAYDIGDWHHICAIEEGSENSNFFLKTAHDRYILTCFEKDISPKDLHFFITLKRNLAKQNMSIAAHVQTKKGDDFLSLSFAGHEKIILLSKWLEGNALHPFDLQQTYQAGAMLAKLHMGLADFPLQREDAFTLSHNAMLLEDSLIALSRSKQQCDILSTYNEKWHSHIKQAIEFCYHNMHALEKEQSLPKGICHLDYFPDNILWVKQHISGVIDFYFAAYEVFIYDIAIALNAFAINPKTRYDKGIANAFLEGYQSERALEIAEKQALHFYQQKAAIRFGATRLHDYLFKASPLHGQKRDPYEYIELFHFFNDFEEPEQHKGEQKA